MKHYADARSLAGRRVGPTPSQWGTVATAHDPEAHLNAIATEETEAEAGRWKARVAAGADGRFIDKALTVLKGPDDPIRRLRVLARDLRRELDRKRWFDGR